MKTIDYGIGNIKTKYMVWDRTEKRMRPPARICFGDDGSALTITVWFKTKEGFDEFRVVGEDCELLPYAGFKDKNEKEICSGDILKFSERNGDYKTGVVRFQEESGSFGINYIGEDHLVGIDFPFMFFNGFSEFEVIGNVFENPELNE